MASIQPASRLAWRPEISSIDLGRASSPAEQFQNQTLRPVLKLQNDLLVAAYEQFIATRKNAFHHLKVQQKPAYITDSLRKDQKLINFMMGLLVGQFTLEEYEAFLADEKEIRKRTLTMLIERLIDQLG